MKPTVLLAACAACWAVCCDFSVAQSETAPPTQSEQQGSIARQRPGEYPDYLFRESRPAPVGETSDEFRDKYLLGNRLGARTQLANEGIKPTVLFISDPFVNASGGQRQGFSEYDLLAVDFLFDTEKLLGWQGGDFHLGFANNSGTSLSQEYVGNNFPVQLADVASPNLRLTYLSYTQSLCNDELSVRFGRLTINSVYGEEFAASQYFKAFTSVAFDLVPLGIFVNAPGAFGYPLTTWGARVKFEPTESFYAMLGCYDGDPEVKDGDQHGVDFSLHGPAFIIGEVGYRRNYGKDAPGLPGNLKLGAYINGGSAAVLDAAPAGQPNETPQARYGFYVVGDQAIVRWGDPTDRRHLGVFGAFACAPDPRVDQLPYFFDAGLVAYGFVPSRPRDFLGFGVAYGSYSSHLRNAEEIQALTNPTIGVQNWEMTLELTYGCTVRPGLLLQPDVQYLVNPGGNEAIANALAVGINVVVSF
jgi:porin